MDFCSRYSDELEAHTDAKADVTADHYHCSCNCYFCSCWCLTYQLWRYSREMGFDPGVFGRFDLADLVQPHLELLFVCLIHAERCGLTDGIAPAAAIAIPAPAAAPAAASWWQYSCWQCGGTLVAASAAPAASAGYIC